MTQEDQERFDLIVNRFEKMDHRFPGITGGRYWLPD